MMHVNNVKKISQVIVNAPGAINVVKQTLVGPAQGWDGWVMRLFTLNKEGYTPKHSHPWPHINYIVSGTGILYLEGKEHEVEPGFTAYVPGGAEHQFKNRGEDNFTFICIVPEEGDV